MDSIGRWKRPEHVPFPSVWRRCTGRRAMPDGKLPKFVIQDVTEDRIEDVVAFMSTYFIKDETICASTKLWQDPISVKELQTFWRAKLKEQTALVALLEDGASRPKIAGCNVTCLVSRDDKDPEQFKGVALKKFVDALIYPGQIVDIFQRYDVNEYLVGMGLSINPEFRGQGLGLEILRARFDLGRAINVRATTTVFTAIQSQVLAAQCGMEVLLEVPFEDYKVAGEVVFPVSFPKSMMLMGARIE